VSVPNSAAQWWRPIAHTPAGESGTAATIAHRETVGAIADYPTAFWCLMAFTFIVLVAPQNASPLLRSFSVAFVAGGASLLCLLMRGVGQGSFGSRLSRDQRLLGIFAALALLSIPFSWWPGGSWSLFTDQLVKSLIVYTLVAHLLVSPWRFRQHLWLILVSGIAIAVMALMAFRAGETVEGYRLAGGIAGLTSNPNDFALTLNLFLPFGLVLCVNASPLGRLVAAVFIVTSVIGIIMSFSRGGFLTLVTVFGLFVLRTVRSRGIPALFGLSLLVLLGFMIVPEGYGTRVSSVVELEKDPLGSATSRLENMIRAAQVAIEHPLLGVGLGQNTLAINEKGGFWSMVHNVYLEIAADLGIPALVVFLLLFGTLIRYVRAIQASPGPGREGQELARLAGATEVSLWAYAVAAMFHPVAYHFYFFYIGGFAAALHTTYRQLSPRMSAV
jgi:O-antigen ligase